MTKKLSPITAFYLHNGFGAFNSGLIFTTLYVYYARTLALTPFQLALIGTVHMAAHVIFELPTGVVADVFGRKASTLLGGLIAGICFIITGAIPLYAVVMAASIVEAIGDTFVSGALEAWLADEVGAENIGNIILRAEQIGTPIHWTGVAGSVLLATLFNQQVPIIVGGALWVVAFFVLLPLMPETGFVRKAHVDSTFSPRSYWRHLCDTFADGIHLVRVQRTVLMLFVAQVLIGGFGNGFFSLNQLHLITSFTLPKIVLPQIGLLDDSAWIAIVNAASSALYVVGIAGMRRFADMNDLGQIPRLLIGLFASVGIGALVFAFTSSFALAILALCILITLNNLTEPLLRTWLNQHITSDVRATVLSMNVQANRLGMMGGGLVIGALGNVAGLPLALGASVLFLLPLLRLFGRADAKLKLAPKP